MSAEIVKKIDKEFLRTGTREEFREAILQLLDLVQELSERNLRLEARLSEVENELRRLKGEKKSPSSSRRPVPDLISRYPSSGRR